MRVIRGEVYWADLAPRSGSEQTGRRPVIVVSHDGFNQSENWMSIIIVPVSTSQSQRRRAPTTVEIDPSGSGLRHRSVALCHQVTTVDRSKLLKRLGALSDGVLRQVEAGLKAAMDLT